MFRAYGHAEQSCLYGHQITWTQSRNKLYQVAPIVELDFEHVVIEIPEDDGIRLLHVFPAFSSLLVVAPASSCLSLPKCHEAAFAFSCFECAGPANRLPRLSSLYGDLCDLSFSAEPLHVRRSGKWQTPDMCGQIMSEDGHTSRSAI